MEQITAQYIKEHVNDSTCILVINNNVYNVTNYLTRHPGGKQILMQMNGSDATQEFTNIQHSDGAKKILEEYKIGTITTNEKSKLIKVDLKTYNDSAVEDQTTEVDLTIVNERLNTHEDKFNIHKIAGTVALLNMLYRSYQNIFMGIHNTYAEPNTINNLTLLCHTVLAISALMFRIPAKRTTAGKNFEYKEMRLHSIIFSLRSLSPIILGYLNLFDSSQYTNRLFNILFWHGSADLVTNIFYDNENGTTIRNGKGSNKLYKNFASFSQIIAISILLGLNNNKYNFKENYNDLAFLIVMPIQLSTFLLTLHKKNFITSNTYGIIYGLSLAILYSQILFTDKQFITLTILMILLRFQNINKYVLYIGFALIAEYLRTNDIDIPIYIPIILSIVFIIYFYINSIEKKIDLTIILKEKTKITNDTYLLKFTKAENFSIPNGHHIIVKNNDVKRPYTPIKNTSDEVHLYIKQYPNGRISSYLANLNIMDKIVVDDVVGENQYIGNGVFKVRDKEIKTNNCINILCAGTGITPAIRILEDNTININIIHCIKSKVDVLPDSMMRETDRIKIYKHMSDESGRITEKVIKEKLNLDNNVVMVCGTKIFNEMMESILLSLGIKKKLIIIY